MNIKEISLQKALNAAACKELPKAAIEDENTYWTKAVALVKKRDGTSSYCLAERGADGRIHYVADYGNPAIIFGLVSIHPYVVVDVKRFGFDGSDDAFKAYMRKKLSLTEEDMAQNTEEDWKRARIQYAITQQEEADRRFQMTGAIEATEEELGINNNVPTEAPDNAIVAEDGSVEEFTVVSQAIPSSSKKRGRKAKK